MATATIVVTYTVGAAGGREAVVTGATIGGTEVVGGSTGTAAERGSAYFLAKDLCRALVEGGKFAAGVNGGASGAGQIAS